MSAKAKPKAEKKRKNKQNLMLVFKPKEQGSTFYFEECIIFFRGIKKKRNVLKELDVFLRSPQEPANADSNANFADAL